MEISKVSDVVQETQQQTQKLNFNLVGIVPIEDGLSRFLLPWADCLMPVAVNYLAIERAVVEAVSIGCDSIWLVSYGNVGNIIRDRLGEWIWAPSKAQMSDKHMRSQTKKVPIYYLLIGPEPGLNVSGAIFRAANIVYSVHRRVSQWVAPDRYYVSFPLGVYPCGFLEGLRKDARSRNGFYLSHENETVANGKRLGFTFNNNELIGYRKIYDEYVLKGQVPTLQNIFGSGSMTFWEKEVIEIEVPFYHGIDSWEKYGLYLASEDAKDIVRPEFRTLPHGYAKTKRHWKGIY